VKSVSFSIANTGRRAREKRGFPPFTSLERIAKSGICPALPKPLPRPTGHPGGSPSSARRRTHAALLAAALRVFAEKGFDDAQTRTSPAPPGSASAPSTRYFADKHQAFIEAITAHLEGTHERVMSNLTVEVFRATLDRRGTPRRNRSCDRSSVSNRGRAAAAPARVHRHVLARPAVMRIRSEFAARASAGVAALIVQVAPPGRILDPEAAAQVIQIAAEEVAIVTMGGRGPAQSPERVVALRSALAEMFLRYVFGE
jgi:AcrR family transcriptional regulator